MPRENAAKYVACNPLRALCAARRVNTAATLTLNCRYYLVPAATARHFGGSLHPRAQHVRDPLMTHVHRTVCRRLSLLAGQGAFYRSCPPAAVAQQPLGVGLHAASLTRRLSSSPAFQKHSQPHTCGDTSRLNGHSIRCFSTQHHLTRHSLLPSTVSHAHRILEISRFNLPVPRRALHASRKVEAADVLWSTGIALLKVSKPSRTHSEFYY